MFTMGRTAEDATAAKASAEVFLMAFRTLSRDARTKVIEELARDEDIWADLEAAALWEQRKDEPRQPFDEDLVSKRQARTSRHTRRLSRAASPPAIPAKKPSGKCIRQSCSMSKAFCRTICPSPNPPPSPNTSPSPEQQQSTNRSQGQESCCWRPVSLPEGKARTPVASVQSLAYGSKPASSGSSCLAA